MIPQICPYLTLPTLRDRMDQLNAVSMNSSLVAFVVGVGGNSAFPVARKDLPNARSCLSSALELSAGLAF